MRDMRVGWVGVLAMASLLAAGCGGKTQPTRVTDAPAQPNPSPTVAANVDQRARDLARRSRAFTERAHQLPGQPTESHRKLMAGVFSDLTQLLPELAGPDPSRTFQLRLRMIDSSRAQLATGSRELSPEPVIVTGLRATYDILSDIGRTSFYEQSGVTQTLDRLSSKVDELDTVHGPLHQVVATEAVDLIAQAIGQMSDVLEKRVAEQSPTATGAPTTSAPTKPAATASRTKK